MDKKKTYLFYYKENDMMRFGAVKEDVSKMEDHTECFFFNMAGYIPEKSFVVRMPDNLTKEEEYMYVYDTYWQKTAMSMLEMLLRPGVTEVMSFERFSEIVYVTERHYADQ